MTTSSPFMDDYSSEDYSSDDYEDLDGFCVLPNATTPQINIITVHPIDDETQSNESQTVTRLEVAAPDSLSSLSDHEVLPDTVCCVELADVALQAAENVVVEGDAMTEESSEAVEADAALETTVVEDGDAMLEESYANAAESDDGWEAELVVEERDAMIEQSSEAAFDAVEESNSKAVEADSLIEPEDDAVEESNSKAVEADRLIEPEDDAVEEFPKVVEVDVAVEPEIAVDTMIEESSEAVEADAALETTVVEDGEAMMESESYANNAVEAAVALALEIPVALELEIPVALALEIPVSLALEIPVAAMIEEFSEAVEADAALETTVVEMGDAMIEEPPVIDKKDYSLEGDDSEEDYSTEGDASEDYSSEGDATSMSSEDSVEFKGYRVEVEIDIEEYNYSSEVDTIEDYSSGGDAIDEFSSQGDASEDYSLEGDASEDYSLEGDAISMEEWSSEDSDEEYCVEVEIDIEEYDYSSEVDTIKDYSSGGDAIDEFSSQGDASEDYSLEGDAAILMEEWSSEDSDEEYCVEVEIDIEEYDYSSEVDTIKDYSSGGDAIDEFSSQLEGDASEDYSVEGDAISMEEWSSEDSDEEYCVEVEIDHVMDTIEDYSSRGDVIEEFSSQGVSIEEYSSQGERDPCKDCIVDDLLEGERDLCKNYYVVLENYCAEGQHDAPSRSETAILVQAILDYSTIPSLFCLSDCLSVIKSCISSFLRFGCSLRSFISALFCKEPIVDKYA